jgi:hypothetical protein
MSADASAASAADEPRTTNRREFWLALAIAWLLVLARGFVFVAFEHAFFDSDQAIVGLMAKHLSEGRAFPLFFYGQSFMLGVESWLAAPVFWIAGPTVGALHASLLVTNLAVVTIVILGLTRWVGLRPWHALAAAAFFALPPLFTSRHLIEAQGGNVEPFLYVLLLWIVRERPFVFGSLLAIGFLNREFTIYAVPVLVVGQLVDRTFWTRATLQRWLFALVTFVIVWDGIQALRPYADLMGPGTRGELLRGFTESQLGNLSNRIGVNVLDLPGRVWWFGGKWIGALAGVPSLAEGRWDHAWPAGLLALFLAIAGFRIAMLAVRSGAGKRTGFAWYVLGVGLAAFAGYVVTRPSGTLLVRYFLLVLYVPVGATAVWLALEPRAWVRRALVAAIALWAAGTAVDNARFAVPFVTGRAPNDLRPIADALVARNVQVAEATYWRAYKITFVARERVKVASSDYVRIDEYQRLANEQKDGVLRIEEQPCPSGEPVGGWFLCR